MRMILIAVALGLSVVPAVADDVFGVWKSEPGETGAYIHVRIETCKADAKKICGTIVKQINSTSGNNVIGRQIIANMEPDGPAEWDSGTIWAPDEDETYSSEMELKGDVLRVSGCILGGLICRGQDWVRVR